METSVSSMSQEWIAGYYWLVQTLLLGEGMSLYYRTDQQRRGSFDREIPVTKG